MPNQTSLISIAVPAYNASHTLGAMIESVLAQSHQCFELIICDDASTDNTVEIAEGFRDPRITLLRNKENIGEGGSRDRALAAANGDWVAVIDADDTWHPHRLARLLDAAGGDPTAVIFDDIMQCHSTTYGMVPWKILRGRGAFGARHSPVAISICDWIESPSLLAQFFFSRRRLLESAAIHSTHRYGTDIHFSLKLLAGDATLIYVPEALYNYRITPGSASNTVGRETTMCEILEQSINNFNDAPDVQKALRNKVARVRFEESYQHFFGDLRNFRLGLALRAGFANPTLLLSLCSRLPRSIFYHLHRIYNGGHTRNSI